MGRATVNEGDLSPVPRRVSKAEVAIWAILAWTTGSTAIALFPYPYMGFVSFLLMPVIAICWTRTVILSKSLRGGPSRAVVLSALMIGTMIGAAVVFSFVRSVYGGPGGD
jgi:hypothetical protein